MTVFKNLMSFFATVIITVILIAAVGIAVRSKGADIRNLISFSENGTVTIMGESFTPDPDIVQSVGKHIEKCNNICELFFPDIIEKTAKDTAANCFSAVKNIFLGFYDIINRIAYGNM